MPIRSGIGSKYSLIYKYFLICVRKTCTEKPRLSLGREQHPKRQE